MKKDGKKHCIYQEKRKHLYVSSGLIIKACHLFMCLVKLRQARIKQNKIIKRYSFRFVFLKIINSSSINLRITKNLYDR